MPPKARVDAFTARERYGHIWVAMEAPRYELPDDPRVRAIPAGWW